MIHELFINDLFTRVYRPFTQKIKSNIIGVRYYESALGPFGLYRSYT